MNVIYCYHFVQKLHHAGHYLGITNCIQRRNHEHTTGTGNPLMRAAVKVGPVVLMVIAHGDYGTEKKYKNLRNGRKSCPICKGADAARAVMVTLAALPFPFCVATLAPEQDSPVFLYGRSRHILLCDSFRRGRLSRRAGTPLCGLGTTQREYKGVPKGVDLAPTCRECLERGGRILRSIGGCQTDKNTRKVHYEKH